MEPLPVGLKGPRPKRGAGARPAGRRWISLFAKCAGQSWGKGAGEWNPPTTSFFLGTFIHGF